MYNFVSYVIFSFSILFPACAALIRFKLINKEFYPFVFFIWLGLINETVSLILAYTIKTNTVNSNIYVLLEYALILYQFYKWNISVLKSVYLLLTVGLVVWVLDNLIFHPLNGSNAIFRIFYSLVIVFFSIDQVNKMIVYEKRNLFKNPVFIICIAFLAYYGCKSFIEVFNAFHLQLGYMFNAKVFMALYVANLISNILYTIAILYIPWKQEFTMPY